MFGLFGKTFTPESDIPDLSGKVILVTGGNTGLGKESIIQLAAHNPSQIYLAARTPSKADDAIAAIKEKHPTAAITYLQLDLSDLKSVASAVETFKSKSERLDILLNNAGIMGLPYSKTKQDYEIQFGTNHIGHALLTKLLLPTLLKTAEQEGSDVRIVNLSSMGMSLAPSGGIIFDQAKLDGYAAMTRYGQSKLANLLHAVELRRRYPQITSVAVHPGVILTDLFAPQLQANFLLRWGSWAFGSLVMGDVRGGALNQLWAATADKAEVRKSAYFLPVGKASGAFGNVKNAALAEKLWDWTEEELKKNGY